MNHEKYKQLNDELEPLRFQLCNHPLYGYLDDVENLKRFMTQHVFAVWDFMCLLKALQQKYCNSQVPWLPNDNGLAARLINEIVLAEESDEGLGGEYISHFGIYCQAMSQLGASTDSIDSLLAAIGHGKPIAECLRECDLLDHVRAFVSQTFEFIEQGQAEEMASVFLFGREDLIPDMFKEIVAKLNKQLDGDLSCFEYYLNRHIELDEDAHGPMAELLLTTLCGDDDDKWRRAGEAARKTLKQRIELWNGIAESISGERTLEV